MTLHMEEMPSQATNWIIRTAQAKPEALLLLAAGCALLMRSSMNTSSSSTSTRGGELGYGGTKVGVDLSGRFKVWRDILGLEGRLTYVHFEDDHHTSNYADSFGFQVGARVSFWKGMLLHLIFEDNINRFDLSQIRFYALLDVTALVGGYGFMAGSPRGIGPGMGQYGGAYGTGMGY